MSVKSDRTEWLIKFLGACLGVSLYWVISEEPFFIPERWWAAIPELLFGLLSAWFVSKATLNNQISLSSFTIPAVICTVSFLLLDLLLDREIYISAFFIGFVIGLASFPNTPKGAP